MELPERALSSFLQEGMALHLLSSARNDPFVCARQAPGDSPLPVQREASALTMCAGFQGSRGLQGSSQLISAQVDVPAAVMVQQVQLGSAFEPCHIAEITSSWMRCVPEGVSTVCWRPGMRQPISLQHPVQELAGMHARANGVMPHAQMLTMRMLRRACSTCPCVSQQALCTGFTSAQCQLSLPPGASWVSKQGSACRSYS